MNLKFKMNLINFDFLGMNLGLGFFKCRLTMAESLDGLQLFSLFILRSSESLKIIGRDFANLEAQVGQGQVK